MAATDSSAFGRLDRRLQRWIWKEGWTDLRAVQEEAIPAILAAQGDVIIAAATAAGKTEAAFLPIASALAASPPAGLGVLYVSPLKALINDQFRRLKPFFAQIDLPVHRWHGDVPASRKRRVLEEPSGALLITPESLEALFVRHGPVMPVLAGELRYVVVDELHAFMGTERGQQLQSLLHRVELAGRRRIPRVALSATLGDMGLAGEFLRPRAPGRVRVIQETGNRQEVRLQVRGYRERPPVLDKKAQREAEAAGDEVEMEETLTGDVLDIGEHLFKTLRGGRHIVFANRRANVELYSDLLRRLSERQRVPNEFWPHHGSLDRTIREDAETALKDATRPATAIATTTLELGIDIASVETIAQIGPPPSVASMRQRLGRSGRRGESAVLRVYIQEQEIRPDTPPQDQLRMDLAQTVAMVRLLAARWCEPPVAGALHLSTLVQQVLSTIAQFGAVRADQAWEALCSRGPFKDVDAAMFAHFLRDLGEHDLMTQTHTGELVLGLTGERMVNHYDFYAAFATPEEYRLVAKGRTLGSLPILRPLAEGMHLIFAGRRWRVLSVDNEHKLIQLAPSPGGRAPSFGGSAAPLHDRIRQEMRQVYIDEDRPRFLDEPAQDLLAEGREAFLGFGLDRRGLLAWGEDTLVFPWTGDRAESTLALQLMAAGFKVGVEGSVILVEKASVSEVRSALVKMAAGPPSDSSALAKEVSNKEVEKHHVFLSGSLLTADYASSHLDSEGAHRAVERLMEFEKSV